MSDFAALNTALSGLITHRRASEQIGHNIANVNTEGFSRTRLELSSAGSGAVGAVFATPREQGDGVKVADLIRIRDEFLERRAYTESGTSAFLTRTKQTLQRIEGVFPEPGETGLASQLGDFWAGFDDVANNPNSLGTRSQLLERGDTIAASLNKGATDLATLRQGGVDQLGVMITDVNATLKRIAELNSAVQDATTAGLPANDLQDQRDVLVAKVAKLTGANTRDLANGMVEVRIGGVALVSGVHATTLTGPVQTPNPTGDATLDSVGWAKVDVQAFGYNTVFGGEMGGIADSLNRILPSYLKQLNTVATTLANDVNALHQTGWGQNDAGAVAPGRDFFAFAAGMGAAAGIGLSTGPNGVSGNPANIAVANGPGLLDGSVAQKLALLHASTAGADAQYKAMISSLGVESSTVQHRSDIQDAITTQIDTQRKGVSGVNMDEEMVNLTMTQHAYSASAKLMTTITEMIDTLINLIK